MPSVMTHDDLARWLRTTREELADVRDQLDSDFQIQDPAANKELELLRRVVDILEPCRVPAAPKKPPGTRFQTLQPLKLKPDLLIEIGLLPQAVGMLIADIINPSKAISRGAEALIKEIDRQDARFAQTARSAFAKLAILQRRLQIPRGSAHYLP